MKKAISLILIFILLNCNLSFAQPYVNYIQELSQLDKEINLITKSILSNNYNEEDITKSLDYINNRLNSISINTEYKNASDLYVRRDYLILSYITSMFKLSVNDLLIYLSNPNSNINYLMDSISIHKNGSDELNKLIFLNKNAENKKLSAYIY